mmetsp:Transcript_44694/g.59320  ORF Transcript_44694/g.59320 Transcript_44694/m.59320 type:complete len:200 (-) Transcript_44694:2378-2977(-)
MRSSTKIKWLMRSKVTTSMDSMATVSSVTRRSSTLASTSNFNSNSNRDSSNSSNLNPILHSTRESSLTVSNPTSPNNISTLRCPAFSNPCFRCPSNLRAATWPWPSSSSLLRSNLSHSSNSNSNSNSNSSSPDVAVGSDLRPPLPSHRSSSPSRSPRCHPSSSSHNNRDHADDSVDSSKDRCLSSNSNSSNSSSSSSSL